MNEVARSVLTPQELNTFNYYVDQYDQNSLSVDDLVTPMLHLLTTPEKVSKCIVMYEPNNYLILSLLVAYFIVIEFGSVLCITTIIYVYCLSFHLYGYCFAPSLCVATTSL